MNIRNTITLLMRSWASYRRITEEDERIRRNATVLRKADLMIRDVLKYLLEEAERRRVAG